MADYQRVVEYLRDIRTAQPREVSDELRRCAIEYAELCAKANERLRQCSTFLQQGLRSEAIHMAEDEPNLLELVAALDLPDAEQWAEFCTVNDLPSPPPLQMERAAQLNEAYTQDQPMEALLDRHRLLALARAPLGERLDVMRKLSANDPTGGFWEKDLRAFERARIQKMPSAFYNAVKNQDVTTITALRAEIEEHFWLEPIPDDLRAAVNEAYNRMHRAEVERQLRVLLPQLQAAYAQKSLEEGARLLGEWREIMTTNGLSGLSSALDEEVAPIRKWITREERALTHQKRFAAFCKDLARMLDTDAGSTELEAAFTKLQKFELPIAEDLEQRYRARLAERAVAARRSYRLRLAAIAGVVLAVLLIAVGVAAIRIYSGSAETWARSIRQANEKHDLTRALALIQDQERRYPRLNSAAALAAAKNETAALQTTFDQEVEAVKALADRLSASATSAKALEASAKPATGELVLAVLSLENGLAQVKTCQDEWKWSDQSALRQLHLVAADLENLRSALRQIVIGQVTPQLTALSGQIRTTDLAALNATAAKISALRDAANLDEGTKATILQLLTSIEQVRISIEQSQAQASEMQTLVRNSGNAASLQKALETFVEQYPNSPLTADFQKALADIPQDKAVEGWRDAISAWGGKISPSSAAQVQRRTDTMQAYFTAYPASLFADRTAAYNDYLKQAADALAEKSSWQTALGDLLTNPMFCDLSYLELSDLTRYYVLGDAKKTTRSVNNLVSISFEAIDPKNLTKRKTIFIDPPLKLTTDAPVLVPHAKFVRELVDRIKLIDETNWDTWGVEVIDRLVKAEDMDLVVRAILLQQVLKSTEQIDGWAIADLYEKSIRDIGRQGVNDMMWWDRDQTPTPGTQEALRRIIETVPKADEVRQRIAARKAELARSVFFSPTGTGLLLHDAAGKPVVYPHGAPLNGDKAWAVTGTVSGATMQPTWSLVQLGQYEQGRFNINAEVAGGLPQGTMVFIVKP